MHLQVTKCMLQTHSDRFVIIHYTVGAAGPKGVQADHGYEDALFAGRVEEILQAHEATQPFFIFWAPHLVHTSLMVPGNQVSPPHLFNFNNSVLIFLI